MASTNINVRTDDVLKARAQQIFDSIGLDLSTAVNLFLRQTVNANNLPFVIGTNQTNPTNTQSEYQVKRIKPIYGYAKDKIRITDDFDEPLEDFKEYM